MRAELERAHLVGKDLERVVVVGPNLERKNMVGPNVERRRVVGRGVDHVRGSNCSLDGRMGQHHLGRLKDDRRVVAGSSTAPGRRES